MTRAFWTACAGLIVRRHLWLLAGAAVVTLVLGYGITRLEFKTSQDTLISPSSHVYQENLRYQEQFGGEPMLVLFQTENIRDLFAPANIEALDRMEAELKADDRYHAVISPLTVVRFFHNQIPVAVQLAGPVLEREAEAAAADARASAAAAGATAAEQEHAAELAAEEATQPIIERNAIDAERLAAAGERTLNNPGYLDFILFDETGAVRPELAAVFPNDHSALMVVRLDGNLSIDEQADAAARVAEVVEAHEIEGAQLLPSGPAMLLKEINDRMRESVLIMGALAVGVMVVVLALVFRARWRLLSLGAVLVSTVWAFGLVGYLGIPLTMVTIAALPVLIGLGVDFAIQVHSRYEEEAERQGDAAAGLREMLVHLGPPLAIAVIAAGSGFLVLHISRVPMVRDFGSMLAVGTLLILVANVLVLGSILYWRDRHRTEGFAPQRGGIELGGLLRVLTAPADARLLPALAIGAVLITFGFWVDQRVTVQTDPERWVPQDSRVLQDLYAIRDTTGSSSELNLMVEANDVTRTEVLTWMADFQKRQLEQHPEELVSSNSIASTVASVTRATPNEDDVPAVLSVAPPAIQDTFLSADGTSANIIFAIGSISLEEREQLLTSMEADVDTPDGVRVTPAGLAVIGIETVNALSANRALMVYVALAVKFVWFLLAYRSLARTVLVLLPVLIAVSGSSAIIYLLGIEINPLTALSGPLVIAISVEFSVLLMGRYLEERERGRLPRDAMHHASARIGRAIMASGLTLVGGFGVLAFSGFPLLESFGIVTALDAGIALLTTLLLLPSLLVWTDEQVRMVAVREPLRPAD